MDEVVKRKFPSPRRESNPRTPIIQPVAQRYTDRAITALETVSVKVKGKTGTRERYHLGDLGVDGSILLK
jgi:hypothetical protein